MAAVVVSLALTLQQCLGSFGAARSPRRASVGLVPALGWRNRSAAGFSNQARGLPEMKETLAQLRAPEGLNTKNGFTQLWGVLALTGGGTLGPEALMTRLVAVGSRLERRRSQSGGSRNGGLWACFTPPVGVPPWRGRNGS